MQRVSIEKPCQFMLPIRHRWAIWMFARLGLFWRTLRREHLAVAHECGNLERLRESLPVGHGVMLCGNNPRTAGAVVMGDLARETPCLFSMMASWHLFNQGWFKTQASRLGGDGIAVGIKNLRMKIFPEVSSDELSANERTRRWAQLQETYLAQQIDC